MDTRYLAYLDADPDFYDLAWSRPEEPDLAVDDASLPPGWRRERRGPWLVYSNDDLLPPTGWKVHVSLRPERAAVVVPRVVGACVTLGVAVKSLASTSRARSEERRVGKECKLKCRSRWSPYH